MFDISWQEIFLVLIVALLVIPPKDLPRAMSTAGKWMRRARLLMNDFQRGLDDLAREAELDTLRRHTEELTRKANTPLTIENVMKPLDEKTDAAMEAETRAPAPPTHE